MFSITRKLHHQNRKWFLAGGLLAACCLILCLLAYQAYDYLAAPQEPIPLEISQEDENTAFAAFTRKIFVEEISANTLTLHYTLRDPQAYGITDQEITLGNYVPGSAGHAAPELAETLDQLEEFSYDQLSPQNRLTYDIMKAQLKAELEAAPYGLYEEVFSPTIGTQAQLPILLAEYSFETIEDVDLYLDLLAQIEPYYESLLLFQKEKSQAGLFMWSDTVQAIIDQCEAFIEYPEENFLITTFEDRISGLPFLSLQQKEAYIHSNRTCVLEHVIPAYQKLIVGLTALKGSGQNPKGVCYFDQGREFYKGLIACTIGSNRSITEIEGLLEERMNTDFEIISDSIRENPDLLQQTSSPSVVWEESLAALHQMPEASLEVFHPASSPEPTGSTDSLLLTPAHMLETLEQRITQDFPSVDQTNYQVKQVHPSLEPYLSPAFYLTPPIDADSQHTIYINGASGYDALSLFTTLAHEGYPGHLYQSLYENACQPDPVRSLFYFGGYTEGWATYAERCSYAYAGLDPNLAELLAANNALSLGIYARADIGIHYRGWDLEQTAAFLDTFGVRGETTVQNIYRAILENPSNYLKYYLGYVEIEKLKEQAMTALQEDFQLKEFHRFVLSIGPAPFSVLEQYLKPWIESQKPRDQIERK
ncbi:MAG: DUF885 domain-containing protein [Lachnospiraceae bacterium]|nr:DUF885 domain-containing protein [Lachnospiraceae bacterium]